MEDATVFANEVAEPEAFERLDVLDLVEHDVPPVIVWFAEGIYGHVPTAEEGPANAFITLIRLNPLRGLATVDNLVQPPV